MAPHRRGGTHRVRPGDETHSKYDTFNHKDLKAEALQRKVYRKDMKKVEMVKELMADDEKKEQSEKAAQQRRSHAKLKAKEEDARKAAKLQYKTITKQKELEEVQRSVGVELSDSSKLPGTAVEEQHEQGNGGKEPESEIIDDTFSDVSSDTTESSSASVDSPWDVRKLRLFEWQYEHMPESCPLLGPPGVFPDLQPREVSYAPHKVLSTKTNQTLFLPGRWYQPGIKTDYVPELSGPAKEAARNGVLLYELGRAVIERAAEWAERTVIQYWNGLMYFEVPPPDPGMDLGLVYSDYKEEKMKTGRSYRRHTIQYRNQMRGIARDKAIAVHRANRHRPTFFGYAPAYLDHDRGSQDIFGDASRPLRRLEDLFYIRFKDCQLPHYYFWRRDGDWHDPTVRNPVWGRSQFGAHRMPHLLFQNKERGRPPGRRTTRVKKTCIPDFSLPKKCRKSNRTLVYIATIERQLYWYGLARTLAFHKRIMIELGKSDAWRYFTRMLSKKYPEGRLPDVPPVDSYTGVNVASKIAKMHRMVRRPLGKMPTSPLMGNEAWTRNDDMLWDVVEVDDIATEFGGESLVDSEESSSGESEESSFSSESEDGSSSESGDSESGDSDALSMEYEYSEESNCEIAQDISGKGAPSTSKGGDLPAGAQPSEVPYEVRAPRSYPTHATESDHDPSDNFGASDQCDKGAWSGYGGAYQVPTGGSGSQSPDGYDEAFEEAFMGAFEEEDQ